MYPSMRRTWLFILACYYCTSLLHAVPLWTSGSGSGETTSGISIDVFIDEDSLQEIYSNSPQLLNDSSMVYVLSNSTSQILSNGSLQIHNTGISLLPLPVHVNSISFIWVTNGEEEENREVHYDISLKEVKRESERRETHFNLSIPYSGRLNDSIDFVITMDCSSESTNSLLSLSVQLNFTLDQSNMISTSFIIQKQCSILQSSSSYYEIFPTSTDLYTPSMTDTSFTGEVTTSFDLFSSLMTEVSSTIKDMSFSSHITSSLDIIQSSDITPTISDISSLMMITSTELSLSSSPLSSSITTISTTIRSSSDVLIISTREEFTTTATPSISELSSSLLFVESTQIPSPSPSFSLSYSSSVLIVTSSSTDIYTSDIKSILIQPSTSSLSSSYLSSSSVSSLSPSPSFSSSLSSSSLTFSSLISSSLTSSLTSSSLSSSLSPSPSLTSSLTSPLTSSPLSSSLSPSPSLTSSLTSPLTSSPLSSSLSPSLSSSLTSSLTSSSLTSSSLTSSPSLSSFSFLPPPPITTNTPTTKTADIPWLLYVVAFGPVVGFLILLICMITCCLCCMKYARKRGSHGFADDDHYVEPAPLFGYNFEDDENADKYKKLEAPISVWTNLSWGNKTSLPLYIQTLVRTINIDRRKIAITNTFLRGANGCLNKGMLMMDRINPSSQDNVGTIMKVMTGLDRGHREDITRFIDQTTLLYGMEHPNLLPLLGLSIEDNCVPIAIYPLTEYGNLHFILEMCRLMPEENPLGPLTTERKVNFSYQLSSAMKFLSDKKVILPDIALRNCWLDTNMTLKLSDSALSQDFYPEAYTNIKGAVRPVKWSAIETLQEGLITTQSNVWSFGVVVWEIFSVAKEPYGDIPNKSIISHLMMGERLQYPSEDCPEQLYSLLLSCWSQKGEERPRFNLIHDTIKTLHKQYTPSHAPNHTPRNTTHSDNDPYTATTFGKPILVPLETDLNSSFNDNHTPRHSQGASNEAIHKRSSGHNKRVSDSGGSFGGGKAELVSLSFSVLDNEGGSDTESESEGGGSFPSTLRSRVSINTTSNNLTPKTDNTICESVTTLQATTPTVPPTILPRPDTATSTVGESTSNRSSILLPAPTCSSTDRSSFYSTGIDSISTTFSTPHPLSHTPNNIEMRSYGGESDRNGGLQVMTTPFKSTDSGIRSDDNSSTSSVPNNSHVTSPGNHVTSPNSHVTSPANHMTSSFGHVTSPNSHVTSNIAMVTATPPTDSTVQLRHPKTEQLRNSLKTDSDRLSFGSGVMDFSSDLMAAFDSFSTFKS